MSDRLNQIEAILERIAEQQEQFQRQIGSNLDRITMQQEHLQQQLSSSLDQITTQQEHLQQQLSSSLDRISAQQEQTQQQINSNARSIEANSAAISDLQNSQQDFRASIEDVIGMITTLSEQAEQDRVEFRATVQRMLDALTQRFSGNGQGSA